MSGATYTIGGDPERKLVSEGVAISLAQARAINAEGPIRIGIYRDGQLVSRVEKLDDGSVVTVVTT